MEAEQGPPSFVALQDRPVFEALNSRTVPNPHTHTHTHERTNASYKRLRFRTERCTYVICS